MLLAPLLALVPSMPADPYDDNNPDYTRTVTWDLDTPGDYLTSGTVVEGGSASLEFMNESATEDSQEDYGGGSMTNLDPDSVPGSLSLDQTYTFKATVNLQPDPAAGQDSFIYQDKDTDNYGTERELRIDSETNRVYRILMRFDLGVIPAGAYIDNASLWLYQNPGGKGNDIIYSIHALSRAFVEDEVTWGKPSISQFWTTPGGDYLPEVYSTGVINNDDDWKTFELSNLVEHWIRGAVVNHGLIIVPNEVPSDSLKDFVSSDEESWTNLRPRLIIDYTMQGNEGAYESGVLGPGTNAEFTTIDWSNHSESYLDDEFSQAPLSTDWTWWNDPTPDGGGYNIGVSQPGWLSVLGTPNSANVDTDIGSNYLHKNVTGHFSATTSIKELFTVDYMHAGMLVVSDSANWLSISKTGFGAGGSVDAVLCQAGTSSTVASLAWPNDVYAHLSIVRDDAGIRLYAGTDGQSWMEVHDLAGIQSLKEKVRIGLFVSSSSAAQPRAEFDYIRVEPLEEPTFEIMIRVGNSTSLTDPSWTDWSSPFEERGSTVGSTAKYIRYRVYLATELEWHTPVFSGFTVHWERHAPTGFLETADYTPEDFSSWLSFGASHDDSNGDIDYYFSTDGGDSWDYFTSDMVAILYSLEPMIRLRAVLMTPDTLTTPSLEGFWLTYGTALATFYVVTPQTAVAGEPFTVDIWAKNSENLNMTNYVASVTMTAMDEAGSTEASAALAVVAKDISSAGHVTVVDQAYEVAETIRIMVESGGATGISAPIIVQPGPMAALSILPSGFDSLYDGSTALLQAVVSDEYGNAIPGLEYEWTVTDGLGELNSTTGPSVVFTAGDPHTTGYIYVTCQDFTASRFVTIECVGHPPEFVSDIPDQAATEDGPTWSYDLSTHVYDPVDDINELRWYVTGEDLVTASDENKTGNLMLTLTPKADLYGEDILWLHVVDSEGESDIASVMVEIEPVNDAPTISPIPHLVVRYEDPYIFDLRHYINDVDNNDTELSLSVDEASRPFVTVNDTRQSLVFNYPESLLGTTQSAVVTVSDGDLQSSTVVRVSVSDDYPPGIIGSLPSVVLRQGEALIDVFDLDEYFFDIEGDSLYYTVSESHVFVNISSTNEVSIYAPHDWSGEEYVIISAIELGGARMEDAMQVTVLPVNQAPRIADVPDLQVRYDKRFEFDVMRYIVDEDDSIDSLVVSVDNPNIAVAGMTLSMLYPAAMNGTTVAVEISVSDGEFTDAWTINVTVSDNNPPESSGAPDHSFTEDWPIPYPTTGRLQDWYEDEEDGDNLTIEVFCWCENLQATIISNAAGDLFVRFLSAQDYNGETKVTLRVTDSDGAIVEDTIILTVTPLPDAPIFHISNEFSVTVGTVVSYDLADYIFDPDSETAQMRLVVEDAYAGYLTVTSTLVRLQFPESFLGSKESSRTIDVEIRAIDQDGLWDTSTLRILVSKPAAAQTVGSWGVFLLLLTAGISLGLFGMVMSMRKKPFVIRDMMLVHEDGFLISRHELDEHEDDMDEDVFTGMLTAVLNFVEDSMASEQEHLKFFGFEHYRIMVKRGGKIYAAVVFEGDRPKDIDAKLEAFLAKVEKVYRKSLLNWTGDIDADFAGAHLMIETFVNGNSRKHRGLNGRNGRKDREAGDSSNEPSEDEQASDSTADATG